MTLGQVVNLPTSANRRSPRTCDRSIHAEQQAEQQQSNSNGFELSNFFSKERRDRKGHSSKRRNNRHGSSAYNEVMTVATNATRVSNTSSSVPSLSNATNYSSSASSWD